eukprot:maker-scaffold13_size735724-snap-gene-6.23 protein:Tk03466 transcript:maker-scaffold13_size735724-snap-gene-6.23-mRNA-1 annotation:"dna polymerase theta isoform x3"
MVVRSASSLVPDHWRSTPPTSNFSLGKARQMGIHQRFYTALALHDLVNEAPLKVVAQKYGASKGMLQSLQQTSSTFAGMVTVFCQKLGWYNLELLIGQFQDRLQFGVHRELIDLCRLGTLNGQRARILHRTKVETVAILANCLPSAIETIFINASPFESEKKGESESEREVAKRREMRSFWVTGQRGLTIAEAAQAMVDEAREVLQKDLGIRIDWNSNEDRQRNLSIIINESESKKKEMRPKSRKTRNSGGKKTNTPETSARVYSKKPVLVLSPHLSSLGMESSAHKRRSLEMSNSNGEPLKLPKVTRTEASRSEFCSTPVASTAKMRTGNHQPFLSVFFQSPV